MSCLGNLMAALLSTLRQMDVLFVGFSYSRNYKLDVLRLLYIIYLFMNSDWSFESTYF